MLLVTDTGTFIISSIIFAKEELQNRKKIRINLKIIFKNLMYHVKSCLPEIYYFLISLEIKTKSKPTQLTNE